jgi:putative ABC transport system ATP-binding protein
MSLETVLRATDVKKVFPDGSTGVANFSGQFEAGRMTSLVGPSGSGKSTLLLCLAGILHPESGSVDLKDVNLSSLSDSELSRIRRDRFGFVFQLGLLVTELTATQNVALPLRLRGCNKSQAEQMARERLATLGVEDLADKRPNEVSVGQSQRIAVARALVGKPSIVFADEPTGALDSKNGEQVFNALRQGAEEGACIVMVTHDESLASRTDRTYRLRDGQLACA